MEFSGTKELAALLPDLAKALKDHGSAVLCAPPGAGKTTTVPQYLLQFCRPNEKIIMLEPRRIAARASAVRIAELLGEKVGETVGYRTRFDTKVSDRTRIEVVTEGILTRMIQKDPELMGIGMLIFDEFHERNIHADLALTLAIEARYALELPLQILVMSATIDSPKIAELLDNAPVLSCSGRLFPVETEYYPHKNQLITRTEHLVSAVQLALEKSERDVLVFLPGSGEIRDAQKALEHVLPDTVKAVPLYGDLPPEAQDAAIRPDPERRKVISEMFTVSNMTMNYEHAWNFIRFVLSRKTQKAMTGSLRLFPAMKKLYPALYTKPQSMQIESALNGVDQPQMFTRFTGGHIHLFDSIMDRYFKYGGDLSKMLKEIEREYNNYWSI